jgi:hypothetical protein
VSSIPAIKRVPIKKEFPEIKKLFIFISQSI